MKIISASCREILSFYNREIISTSNVTTHTKHGLSSILLLACFSINTSAWSLEVIEAPSLTMDPNGVTPLAGVVNLTTDVPARVTVNISNGIDAWSREFSEYQTNHYLPILGLKPNNSYSIEITITDDVGNQQTISPTLLADTNPLPDDFPNISVLVSEPDRMEPGLTLCDLFKRASGGLENHIPDGTLTNYSMILDNAGEVVWYSTLGSRGMKQLQNGHLLYNSGPELIEIDMLGNEQRTTQLQTRSIHHEIFTESNGNILSLTQDTVAVDDYPSSDIDPNAPTQSITINDNPIIEFSPSGAPLGLWRLSDMLDPKRIGYSSLHIYPNDNYDWAHANAVIQDPRDDSIIVSIRHQDAVVKFSKPTGTLKWILGNHNNWPLDLQPYLLTPVGSPFEWQFHQHAPTLTPSGNILLFDNGNFRASPFDGTEPPPISENYSRAVEYSINEQTMEVQQVWEYGSLIDQRYYSDAVGDADWMDETGNVLITYGALKTVAGVESDSLGMGKYHIRVVEVDHNAQAEKVFEIAIYNSTPNSRILGYRAERIPGLYPADTDSDGISDYQDNCIYDANGPLISDSGGNSQYDTDNDGIGNVCDADLNNDGQIDSRDLGLLKLSFLSNDAQPNFNPDADLNGDGNVNSLDLGIAKTFFNQ